MEHVRDCIRSGDYCTLDPGIDDCRWFTAKAIKARNDLKGNYKLFLVPLIPTVGWHAVPSQNIPSLFNYEQTYYYALESIQHFSREDQDNRLGYMTDTPVKNSIKNGDSGFVVVVLSVNSGAVMHASCEPCRASSLGRCSHIVGVLFLILDHIKKHGLI